MQPTLPWSWYADETVLRREQERIFARTWQYVGHTGQVAEPGTFFTSSAGQIPVVVTRARDGELRALLNVCRHRGFAVFDGDELRLLPLAVDTWGPFVFVNPDADAPPLRDALGPLPDLVARIVDLDALRFRFRSELTVEANWKIACENFHECYHCALANPGFSAAVDASPDRYRLETDGLTSSQFGELRNGVRSFLAGGEIPHSQFHFLWPNFGINIFPGHPNLSCGP